jgi:hypothetical protein
MEAAPEPSLRPPRLPLSGPAAVLGGLALLTLLAAAFLGDGSDVDGILPVGGAAVLLLGIALVIVALGWLAPPRLGGAGLLTLAAMLLLTGWIGATVAWSIAPDRSWDAFNRSLAFTAFLLLGMVLAATAGRVASRLGATVLSLALGIVLTWALLT